MMKDAPTLFQFLRSGALAGAASALVFTWIHDLFISNIWFSLVIMVLAGAVCGLCIGWTYHLMFPSPSTGSWLRYNLLYVVMFGLLGALSVAIFEPVTTIGALIALNGPPDDLIRQAMPMTVGFTLASALVVGRLYAKTWHQYGAVLLTCIFLVLFLGLNVSTIGLVEIPAGSLYLIAELFGLIVALNLVYVLAFLALERRHFTTPGPQG